LNLKDLEEDLSKEAKKIQSQDEANARITGFLSSIGLLRDELALLDKEMTRQVKAIESKLKEIHLQLEFIGDNLDGLQAQIYRLEERVDFFHEY